MSKPKKREIITPLEHLNRALAEVNQLASSILQYDHRYEKQNFIARYIAHERKVDIAEIIMNFTGKGMSYFGQSLLLAPNVQDKAISMFRQSAYYAVIAIGLETLVRKRLQTSAYGGLTRIAGILLRVAATGQMRLLEQQVRIFCDGFIHGYGAMVSPYDTNDNWDYAGMAFNILKGAFNITVDFDALRIRTDPGWLPLVQFWDTDDLELIQSVLLGACDHHMSKIALFKSYNQFAYDSQLLTIHPTEILAVLRLREAKGLPNPTLDHPLMNTPYAKLTASITPELESPPIVDAIFKAIAERDPDIMQWWNEFMPH